jgi:peptidoglycan/LPS O-acetylase OafA/YrhL
MAKPALYPTIDRHNNFDLMRLLAALSVVFSHAFLIGEGQQVTEPLMLLTGGQCVLGVAGVFVFFTISGFLVSASCEATGSAGWFLAKRALRIYPGLACCVVVSAFVLGPAVTQLARADYFADPGPYKYVLYNLLMYVNWNSLPGVSFTGFAAGSVVDGPLWSLPSEVLMYLMLAVLGALRLLRLPVIGVLLAAGLVGIVLDSASSEIYLLGSALWLLPFFAAGMALYRLRARAFGPRLALVALVGLAVSIPLGRFILLFPIFGSYLVLYAALERRLPLVPAARFGDLSYGLYIYGWPVEQLVTRLLGGAAPWWQVFALSLPAAAAVAFLSWHLVEATALRFKPGARRGLAVAAPARQA